MVKRLKRDRLILMLAQWCIRGAKFDREVPCPEDKSTHTTHTHTHSLTRSLTHTGAERLDSFFEGPFFEFVRCARLTRGDWRSYRRARKNDDEMEERSKARNNHYIREEMSCSSFIYAPASPLR
jgi:hypothetical protein